MLTGSKKILINLIKQNGMLSIDNAVEQTDLAKTTVREHFLQLERDGYVDRKYVRAGPGRPSLQYLVTKKGNRLFPSSESDLIRELINYLKGQGEEKKIEEFFEAFWEKRLQKAREKMDNASEQDSRARLNELMKFLEEEGFMPEYEVDEEKGAVTIRECNCPFSEVVKETRLPCQLEAMFYKKLFETDVERKSYIAEGDYSCTYDISLNQ